MSRNAVTQLAGPAAHGREMLASEALRPAATTDRWQTRLQDPEFACAADKAMTGISVIETANAEEEALTIAVCLREAVGLDKTAALVTPTAHWPAVW
jgi:ATP-dependent helicase/nuclease subunit B